MIFFPRSLMWGPSSKVTNHLATEEVASMRSVGRNWPCAAKQLNIQQRGLKKDLMWRKTVVWAQLIEQPSINFQYLTDRSDIHSRGVWVHGYRWLNTIRQRYKCWNIQIFLVCGFIYGWILIAVQHWRTPDPVYIHTWGKDLVSKDEFRFYRTKPKSN